MKIEVIGEPNCTNTSSYQHEFPCTPYKQKYDPQTYALSAVYITLLVVGLPLNTYVIWVIGTIIRAGKDLHSRHIHLYILSLSTVDGMVMLTIPLLLSDILLREYVLGGLLCRIQLTMEMFHKIFSSFILTALSWDRFSAIRSPMSRYGRNQVAFAWKVLAVSLVIFAFPAGILLVYTGVDVRTYTTALPHGSLFANVTDVKRCTFKPSKWMEEPFGILTFTVGFAIPVTAITLFYALAVFILCKQIGGRLVNTISMGRVTRSVLMVVVFYYVCWTPYWIIEVLLKLISLQRTVLANTNWLMYVAHCLTLANSSINPILYVLLNRELRTTYHTAATEHSQRADASERSVMLPASGSKRLAEGLRESGIQKLEYDTDL